MAKRNYRDFICFLITTSVLCCCSLGFSVYHIIDVSLQKNGSGIQAFDKALQHTGPSIALAIYSFIVFCYLGYLVCIRYVWFSFIFIIYWTNYL